MDDTTIVQTLDKGVRVRQSGKAQTVSLTPPIELLRRACLALHTSLRAAGLLLRPPDSRSYLLLLACLLLCDP